MLKIQFTVNTNGLEYFTKKLSNKTSAETIFHDANALKNELELIWNTQKTILFKVLSVFFYLEEKSEFTVEVYPEYFYLGAINLERKIIILGQPRHSPNYYMGLLGHELTHFFMKGKQIDRSLEEILCFFLERKIVEEIDHINAENFSYVKNISEFHLHALSYVHQYYNDFDKFFQKQDLKGLLEYIDTIVDKKDKNILIPTNITSYLKFING